MKTATVRDLRNHFARVSRWIAAGQSVEITKKGRSFARLVPAAPVRPTPLVKPNFAARLKRAWGDRVYSQAEVAAMRAAELEGDLG